MAGKEASAAVLPKAANEPNLIAHTDSCTVYTVQIHTYIHIPLGGNNKGKRIYHVVLATRSLNTLSSADFVTLRADIGWEFKLVMRPLPNFWLLLLLSLLLAFSNVNVLDTIAHLST